MKTKPLLGLLIFVATLATGFAQSTLVFNPPANAAGAKHVVLLSGDPLDYRTHVLETWVEGNKVFDLAKAEDRLYAVGGLGAGHDQPLRPHLCGDFDDEEFGR